MLARSTSHICEDKMPYIAVVQLDGNNRVAKLQEYATQAEADAHVTRVLSTYPLAYAAEKPAQGRFYEWVGNTTSKTLTYTAASVDIASAKSKKLSSAKQTLASKIDLGWVYNTKTYQVGGTHAANMDRFINAYNYMWATIPAWLTATAYVAGDIRRNARIFYKCLVDHTSNDFATDLAAAKWAVWYFHPFKGGDGKWRDKDNAMNLLTTEQARTMCEGALNYVMQCQAQYVVHKDAINALGTIANVDSYDVTTGYPTNS